MDGLESELSRRALPHRSQARRQDRDHQLHAAAIGDVDVAPGARRARDRHNPEALAKEWMAWVGYLDLGTRRVVDRGIMVSCRLTG